MGEIYIGGLDAVAEGYLGMQDLTEQKFVADPLGKQLSASGAPMGEAMGEVRLPATAAAVRDPL